MGGSETTYRSGSSLLSRLSSHIPIGNSISTQHNRDYYLKYSFKNNNLKTTVAPCGATEGLQALFYTVLA